MCPSAPSVQIGEPSPPPRYGPLNDRTNAAAGHRAIRGPKGVVATVRFVEGGSYSSGFRYRDVAEMNLARYLEARPGITCWGRRSSPLSWSSGSKSYRTIFPFEACDRSGVRLIAIVTGGMVEHSLWDPYVLGIEHGRCACGIEVDLVGGGEIVAPEGVSLDYVDRHPWSHAVPKSIVELLLKHRSTYRPEVFASIRRLFDVTGSMRIREIVSALDSEWTYAQVMQMVWSGESIRHDVDEVLGPEATVGLGRSSILRPVEPSCARAARPAAETDPKLRY